MPVLNMVRINRISLIATILLKAKKKSDYLLVLTIFYKVVRENLIFKVILIDCKLTFNNTIENFFQITVLSYTNGILTKVLLKLIRNIFQLWNYEQNFILLKVFFCIT